MSRLPEAQRRQIENTVYVINHSFRRNGLRHLTWARESLNSDDAINVFVGYRTFCGKKIWPGEGTSSVGRLCPECHCLGAKAERIERW